VTKQNPRPRKYASDAERQAAYRSRAAEVCVRLEPKTMATLDSIAEEIGYSRNELMQSMVKFGLTNRDWRNEGLTAHKRLPRYEENPMATKPPSAAQLAARERFAEMARSGSLNRKRQIAAKKRKANPTGLKFQVGKYYETRSIGDANIKIGATILDRTDKTVKVKGTDGQMKSSYRLTIDYDGNERFYPWGRYSMAPQISADDEKPKRNPAKKTVSQKISQLVNEGYPQKQAVAVALNEQRAGKVKRNPSRATPKSSTVYVVEYSKDGKKWDTWMKVMYLDMAKAIAERLAIDPYHKNHYIRVESIREVV